MKNTFYIGLTLLLVGLVLLMVKFNLDVQDLQYELNSERIMKDKKIEELEKEIRILKQDVQDLQYGFMEEQND